MVVCGHFVHCPLITQVTHSLTHCSHKGWLWMVGATAAGQPQGQRPLASHSMHSTQAHCLACAAWQCWWWPWVRREQVHTSQGGADLGLSYDCSV